MSFRKIFGSSLLRRGCLMAPSVGSGRPALNLLNMSATVVVLFRRRDCRNHIRGVDAVWIGIVGVDGNALAVMLDMIGTQIYSYFKSGPRCRGFGSGAGKPIEYFD